jgi:hypothetical protein
MPSGYPSNMSMGYNRSQRADMALWKFLDTEIINIQESMIYVDNFAVASILEMI